MKSSFQPIPISLSSKRGESNPNTSPQQEGTKLHKNFAAEINKSRDERAKEGIVGKMLKEIEDKFNIEFIKAEVSISGYAANKSKVVAYSGIMDAVAIRLRSRPEDDLKVFVVDWKTTAKTDLANLSKWWDHATNFKIPLYQCLLYRGLLQMHLKRNEIKAQVGIMLVPFHQKTELLMPGLCMDFKNMDKEGLLEGLKQYKWSAEEPTITLPRHLFKSVDPYTEKDNKTKRDEEKKEEEDEKVKGEVEKGDGTDQVATCRKELFPESKVEDDKEKYEGKDEDKEEKRKEDKRDASEGDDKKSMRRTSLQGREVKPNPINEGAKGKKNNMHKNAE